jgi:hypothetical protein
LQQDLENKLSIPTEIYKSSNAVIDSHIGLKNKKLNG